MKNLTPPRAVGVAGGILLAVAYLLLASFFGVANIADFMAGLGDSETDFGNATLYIFAGAIFVVVLVATITTIRGLGEKHGVRNPSTWQIWMLIVFLGAFFFLCFPLTILTENILATAVLLIAPVLGVFVGREIAKRVRQKILLNDDEIKQAYGAWLITFFIIIGFLQAMGSS